MKKTILILALFSSFSLPAAEKYLERKSEQIAQSPIGGPQGTHNSPVAIELVSPPKFQVETTTNEAEANEKARNDRTLVNSTIWLAAATTLLMIFTFTLWRSTSNMATEARNSGAAQITKMQESVNESARVAKAMEAVAIAMVENVRLAAKLQENLPKQMRAYLAVLAGQASFQKDPHGTYLFEARPQLLNVGATPAYKVCYRAKAAIENAKLPDNFSFSLQGKEKIGPIMLPPQQPFFLNAVIEESAAEDDFQGILAGYEKRLFIWGIVEYVDVFGNQWETKFCHSIVWPGGNAQNNPTTYYNHPHNEAT